MVNNYLTGKCLIAMPHLQDEFFENSLVYICSHTRDGAMGFVINKTIKEFQFSDLVSQFNVDITAPVESIVLHQGGPLEQVRGFVLHSKEYAKDGTVPIDDKFAVSSSIGVLNDIAFGAGPRYNLVALGYSRWESGQLEKELIFNNWLVTDPTSELLFRTRDEDKWQRAMDELDFDFSRLYPYTGMA